jgi:hypothetical protein
MMHTRAEMPPRCLNLANATEELQRNFTESVQMPCQAPCKAQVLLSSASGATLTAGRPPCCDWLSPIASRAALAVMPAMGPAAATSHRSLLFFSRLWKGVTPPKLPICRDQSNKHTQVQIVRIKGVMQLETEHNLTTALPTLAGPCRTACSSWAQVLVKQRFNSYHHVKQHTGPQAANLTVPQHPVKYQMHVLTCRLGTK